jgi:hypothetical protein
MPVPLLPRRRPDCHSSSRCVLVAQRVHRLPEAGCSKAISWPRSARFSAAPVPRCVVVLQLRSSTFGDSTKKPPLIIAPSPFGFSLEAESTLLSCMSSAPKRPGGKVAVRVASLPCCGGTRSSGDVDVAHAVAVGEAERLLVAHVVATRRRRPPVIDSSPVSTSVTFHGSARLLMHFHLVVRMSNVTSDVCRK